MDLNNWKVPAAPARTGFRGKVAPGLPEYTAMGTPRLYEADRQCGLDLSGCVMKKCKID